VARQRPPRVPQRVLDRLRAQRLTGPPAASPLEVTTALLAVQAQELRGARLSVRRRTAGLTVAALDAALGDGSLVVSWLNRGTLHLVRADDYWWLHALTTPQLVTSNRRRLEQEGVGARQAARGVDVVTAAVEQGPQTRQQLRDRLDAARVPTAGQALVHVLWAAALAGHVVRGPMVGAQQAYVAAAAWVGDRVEPDPDEALARLAHRYLVGHGPADAADLARWAGTTLGKARRGLAAVADRTVPRPDGLVDLADRPPAEGLPAPRLHGPYDPLLLGWASRTDWVAGHEGLVTTNGIFRPFALVEGRAVATWGLADGVMTLRPLEPVRPGALAALRRDAHDVLRYLGLPQTDLVTDRVTDMGTGRVTGMVSDPVVEG
jgi:hypothetical protein